MNIRLQEGIDREFFNLLRSIYSPLLSAHHLKDRFQFTIFADEYPFPVGVISINRGENSFMQFALIPEARGLQIAQTALAEIVQRTRTNRVGWGCKRINYPSLKILYDCGGGLFENSARSLTGQSYEGFFRVGKPVSACMRSTLSAALASSKKHYADWIRQEYAARHKEILALRNFLFRYMDAIDAHCHVYPADLSFAASQTSELLVKEFLRLGSERYREPDELLSYMKDSSIARTIVFGLPDHGSDLARTNRAVLRYCSHNRRLIPFAILHSQCDVAQAVKDGFRGFKEHVYGQRLNAHGLATKDRMRLYADLAALGKPLISHLGSNMAQRVEGILTAVPDIKLIVAHLGSPMDRKMTWPLVLDALRKLTPYPSVSFDVSAVSDLEVIETAIDILGVDRLVWGSDWPYEPQAAGIQRLLSSDRITCFDLHKIFRVNIERIVGSAERSQ